MFDFKRLGEISFIDRMIDNDTSIKDLTKEEIEELRTPSDETVRLLRTLKENEAFQKLFQMSELLFQDMAHNVMKSVMAYTAKKADGYTILDLNGAFLSGLQAIFNMVNQYTNEEIEKQKKEVADAEEKEIQAK